MKFWPLLRLDTAHPTLEEMTADGDKFVTKLVLPQDANEREFLARFARGELEPGLLFEDAAMARAALPSPAAQWKLRNLRSMKS